MPLFYAPDIAQNNELPAEEAGHLLRVLRAQIGDKLHITDGKGSFYNAKISDIQGKRCYVEVQEVTRPTPFSPVRLHIAVAPTKNMDRIEWFMEKSTEIGIDRVTCLLCRHSERKEIKTERLYKIAVSAMKQSQKAWMPEIVGMTPFKAFVEQPWEGLKFIAHCEEDDKTILKQACPPGENALILIGPEGDFSPEEIALALQNGFRPISLGESRLRTETAALVACHTIQLINQ
ncbi:16S rRNA (uracil1498-N3)-methyltransferase [Parabacteroides sp. PFB2-10]|uniref:16S rRNA (uracil(1498)-N(3))-methyltransferase n=1 Tax=Parabacteroides sp. PFB2-10 TaxID=1742405 RepID=UPI002475B1DD|nr:16S rRNA (uracil(1498)-N(3))-methyltransferase [Parabacteroides sp. PFB2-10]MDH6311735.1 16S rRNA (uracil1498-N3)-methyltransferase [Parabacteroides sp. PFB2-10]